MLKRIISAGRCFSPRSAVLAGRFHFPRPPGVGAFFPPCRGIGDTPPKPHRVGPASWPVGNVEPAFQPATPTFLSALSAANPKPSRAALIQRVLSPLFAFSLRLRASALKSFVYEIG